MKAKHLLNAKIGWKAVSTMTNRPGEFFSIVRVRSVVLYKFFKKAIPQQGCGPLTVFKTRAGVRYFCGKMRHMAGLGLVNIEDLKYFRCVYTPSKTKAVWIAPPKGVRIYRMPLSELEQNNESCIIPGTVDLAGEVILLPCKK